jgi:hypothetical protein
MNAPLPDAVRRALAEVTLDDNRAPGAATSARAEVKARSAGRSHKWTH